MAALLWKVTAFGPNQASYSMATTRLLPSATSGPVAVEEEAAATADAKRTANVRERL
jgi:hypothetical protein